MKRKQQGFTAFELLAVLWSMIVLGCVGGVIYVACHFIAKYW